MQKALWDIGAFKGIKDRHGREATLETVVDGIDGSMTQQALANAKRMGYVQKSNNGFVKKQNSNILTKKSGKGLQSLKEASDFSKSGIIENFLISQGVPPQQVKNIKLPEKPIDRDGNLTSECAAYVNGILKKNGIKSWGHSYQINSQFKDFINGYDNIDKPTNLTTSNIMNFHRQAADNLANNIDTLQMNPNHLYTANMYYANNQGVPSAHTTDYYNEAINNGNRQYATHVGLIYHDKDKNQWRVTHNINGGKYNEEKPYDEPLYEDLGGRARHGYGITSIADAGKMKNWWEF